MRSHAVMNASCGPASYNFRRRFLTTECHFGSDAFASDSSASSSSTSPPRRRRSAPWCKATPRSEAAAACNGRPVDAPGSMRQVATPAQIYANLQSASIAHPALCVSPSARSPPCLTLGTCPPRSSVPAMASAPTIWTPHARIVRPSSRLPKAGSTSMSSITESSAGVNAPAATRSRSSSETKPSALARRTDDRTSPLVSCVTSEMFWRSTYGALIGATRTTCAVNSRKICSTLTSPPFSNRHAETHSSAATAVSLSVACSTSHFSCADASSVARSTAGRSVRACLSRNDRGVASSSVSSAGSDGNVGPSSSTGCESARLKKLPSRLACSTFSASSSSGDRSARSSISCEPVLSLSSSASPRAARRRRVSSAAIRAL